jgi:nitroreductase
MDVIEAIRTRRATRAFAADEVTVPTLQALIAIAVEAPSAINLQPWLFAVARRRPTLHRIAEAAKAYLLAHMEPGSPFLRFREMLQGPGFDMLYGAPALVVICAANSTQQAAEDCALAAQTFMLAACAQGLATCCIGLARPWLNQPDGKALLGIPSECVPILPIALGKPAAVMAAPGRRPPEIRWVDAPN